MAVMFVYQITVFYNKTQQHHFWNFILMTQCKLCTRVRRRQSTKRSRRWGRCSIYRHRGAHYLRRSRFRHVIREHAFKIDRAGSHHKTVTGNAFGINTQDDVTQPPSQVEAVHFFQDMTTTRRIFVNRLSISRQLGPRYASNVRSGRWRSIAKVHEIVSFGHCYRRTARRRLVNNHRHTFRLHFCCLQTSPISGVVNCRKLHTCEYVKLPVASCKEIARCRMFPTTPAPVDLFTREVTVWGVHWCNMFAN